MTAEQVWGVVRAILAAIGGYFVGKGLFDAGTLDTVLGAAGTVFVAVWSVWSKAKDKA